MAYCKEYDGIYAPIPKQKRVKPVKTESQEKILKLLKEHFPESFTINDAVDLIFSKIGLRHTSVRNAIGKGKKDGLILRRGGVYVWSEVIQRSVAARLQEQGQSQNEKILEMPPVP